MVMIIKFFTASNLSLFFFINSIHSFLTRECSAWQWNTCSTHGLKKQYVHTNQITYDNLHFWLGTLHLLREKKMVDSYQARIPPHTFSTDGKVLIMRYFFSSGSMHIYKLDAHVTCTAQL